MPLPTSMHIRYLCNKSRISFCIDSSCVQLQQKQKAILQWRPQQNYNNVGMSFAIFSSFYSIIICFISGDAATSKDMLSILTKFEIALSIVTVLAAVISISKFSPGHFGCFNSFIVLLRLFHLHFTPLCPKARPGQQHVNEFYVGTTGIDNISCSLSEPCKTLESTTLRGTVNSATDQLEVIIQEEDIDESEIDDPEKEDDQENDDKL
ncbi:MAG: hypothetical protein EZS28_000065 [Streblomastix strix]|uniref:Uncharacterized protein n=1 Tax=Streblomastix strix TaxID=222440 RepID=A0A5J4XC44_9EUKA|nr:MAG: hypothetical protein EZS28_000065 [Streblomastix strix]